MFVVAGGPAPGGAGAAAGRVRYGAGRRGDRDVDPGDLRGVRAAAWAGGRRPVQVVRLGGGRHRLGRGRGCAAGGAAVGRAAERAPGAGRGARFGDQPGRREQRPDRAERSLPAARDPRRAGECRSDDRRHRCRGGARHGHLAGRSDRGAGAAGDVRAGPDRGCPVVAGVGEVEHRSHPGGGRCRGRHQNGDGHAGRGPAAHPARGRAHAIRRLDGGRRLAPHRGP